MRRRVFTPETAHSRSKWEIETARLVRRSGLRPRLNCATATYERSDGQLNFCYPDLAFPQLGLVIFLDGCYWHGCPAHHPTRAKAADRRTDGSLESREWIVLRFWECDGPQDAASAITRAIRAMERAA